MLRYSPLCLNLFFPTLLLALPAKAQENSTTRLAFTEKSPPSYSIGIGAAHIPDYEGSEDYSIRPIPHLNIDNINGEETYLRLSGSRLSSNVIEHPHWRFGLSVHYLFDYLDDGDNRLEKVDDQRVSRLAEPDSSLQSGVTLGYDFSALPHRQYLLEITATRDLIHGNGSALTPRLQMTRPLSHTLIYSAGVSATWVSDRYMANRFGISDTDSMRSGLPVYTAKAGWKNVSMETSLAWIISPEWMVTSFASYRRMTSDAADSPIVDQRGDTDNTILGTIFTRVF